MQAQYLAARHQQLHLIRTEKRFERRLRYHHVKTTLECFELLKQIYTAYSPERSALVVTFENTPSLSNLRIQYLFPRPRKSNRTGAVFLQM